MTTVPATLPWGLRIRDEAPASAPVPLLSVSVDAVLRDFAAHVTLTQRYRNAESAPIEAVYVFPVDESAAVCAFEAEIGGRRVTARVEEREQAFARYDDALAAGHGAYLLDQETPDVFTASLGNVPPGAEVVVRIATVSELPLEGDHIRFTVPTTVSPRYAPASDRTGVGPTRADRLNPPLGDVDYGLRVSVAVQTGGRIVSAESPSHPIRVEALGEGRARVELATRETALDRDFVLKVALDEPARPRALLETAPDGRAHVLASFRPAFEGAAPPAGTEVVFVVDRSGSMQGTSIAEARNALQLALGSLQPGTFFNIVGFGDSYQALFPESRAYGDDTLKAARAHVRRLDADLGGTEILPALTFVLQKEPQAGRSRQVLLLTDGEVTNVEEVIALVRAHSTHTRVFTFGIGAGASHHLVRGVARAGEGAAEFIAPGERIEAKVMRQLRRLLAPGLTDVRLEWSGTVEAAPFRVPAVFSGERLLVYGRFEGTAGGEVTLHARGPSGDVHLSVPVEPLGADGPPVIATLWARAALRDLEEGRSRLHDRRGSLQERGREDRVKSEIVRIATAYGLASRETSFVAVEERETPVQGEAQLRRIPIALTSGWGGTGRGGGASITGGAAVLRPSAPAMAAPAGMRRAMAPPSSPLRPASAGSFIGRVVHDLGGLFRDEADTADQAMEHAGSRPVDRLVDLQLADGSWDLTDELAAVLGTSRGALDKAAQAEGWTASPARRAWATALALTWLERRAAGAEDEWALLADKARAWLRAQPLPADALSKRAREVIGEAG